MSVRMDTNVLAVKVAHGEISAGSASLQMDTLCRIRSSSTSVSVPSCAILGRHYVALQPFLFLFCAWVICMISR
jgi:hypothetical protein